MTVDALVREVPSSPIAASRRRCRRAVGLLQEEYGSPGHGNHEDPLDELVFIVLSQMTTRPSYERVFERLRSVEDGWRGVLVMPTSRLQLLLVTDAGLAAQKAPRIQGILRRVDADFGSLSPDSLARMSDEEAERYLVSLPGVGVKTARCVLMYSLHRPVLPVDN